MQTKIVEKYLNSPQGKEADAILRSCVHCGFCTATCPTYQLLGDELDGPRGRIYLMKQIFEGTKATKKTQLHLDRCLTCRSCETTCPSGVTYGRLVDIGRHIVEKQVGRSFAERIIRKALRIMIPNTRLFAFITGLGRMTRPYLPDRIKAKIPVKQNIKTWPNQSHKRKMLVLDGCVQPVTTPNTNASAARVLDKMGIQLIRAQNAGCCGALSHHLSAVDESLKFIRRNIDAWWPYIEQGAEAIVITASGCGTVIKDYGDMLKGEPDYAEKAQKVSELAKDIVEVLQNEDLKKLNLRVSKKVAFHSPCTLQHGQKLKGNVESILTDVGFTLTYVESAHLCCGSAGTYSILQPKLSRQLLNAKLDSLQLDKPDVIATANVGCQMHLSSKANVPVKHWVELIEEAIN